MTTTTSVATYDGGPLDRPSVRRQVEVNINAGRRAFDGVKVDGHDAFVQEGSIEFSLRSRHDDMVHLYRMDLDEPGAYDYCGLVTRSEIGRRRRAGEYGLRGGFDTRDDVLNGYLARYADRQARHWDVARAVETLREIQRAAQLLNWGVHTEGGCKPIGDATLALVIDGETHVIDHTQGFVSLPVEEPVRSLEQAA